MKETCVRVLRTVLLGGLLGIACDRAPARQPESTPPSPARAEPPAGAKPGRGDQSRRRTREDLQALRDRADAAIRRIDGGEDAAQVREEFDRSSTWRSGGRGGRSGRPEGMGREGGPSDDRPGARALPGFEVTPEERQQLLKFLDEHVPRVGAKFREMDKANPELVTRLLARMRPRVREVLETGQTDPGGTELKISEFRTSLDVMWARRGVDEARGSGDEGTLKAKRDELRAAIAAHFDAQLALQEHEADRLAERVEKLRADIKDRRAGKDRIVDREMEGPSREGPGERNSPRPDRREPKDHGPDAPRGT